MKLKFTFLFFSFLITSIMFGQNILLDGEMESASGWTVYDLNGAGVDSNYEFNYSGSLPLGGSGGCLRIVGDASNPFKLLFWQEVTVEAGKIYKLDADIKTASANKNFYAQTYLSNVAPVAGQDYKPNSNDVKIGVSTWKGCGSGLNGSLAELYCQGTGELVTVSGTAGQNVDLYYAMRVGTSDAYPSNNFECLLDNLSLELYDNWLLESVSDGDLDNSGVTITDITPGQTVSEFKNKLITKHGATVEIIDATTKEVIADQSIALSETMVVQVTGNQTSEYTLSIRSSSTENEITSIFEATVDNTAGTVSNFPVNIAVVQLMTGLEVSPYATYRILNSTDVEPTNYVDLVDATYKVEVTSESGAVKIFTIELGSSEYTDVLNISGDVNANNVISKKIVTVQDNSTSHITGTEDLFNGTILNLTAGNSWIYIDHIKPSVVINNYLKHFSVDGAAAVADENLRVDRYLEGTVLMSHASDYTAFKVYKGTNQTGEMLGLGNTNLVTDNKPHMLGTFDDAIKSFTLKKGWMATLAQNADGTGYSRVFIADEEDLIVNELPASLIDKVSFVKVFKWSWPRKKGWCGGDAYGAVKKIDGDWFYAWNAGKSSSQDVEYAPMRHNASWPGYGQITKKKNVNHVLGFNEPTHKDQANMTLEQMINQWPELLKTGFRLGSPAPADDGINRLYNFMDACEELNFRVDFIAMHYYLGGTTPKQMYNRLKAIHNRCGKRPIWITEWNNGANWTDKTEKVTEAIQEKEIPGFLHMLDTCSFVERYSIYNWVGDGRRMTRKNGSLTPAGEIYKYNNSPKAFNPKYEEVPRYLEITRPYNFEANLSEGTIKLKWKDQSGNIDGYYIERKIDGGAYEVIETLNDPSIKSFNDDSWTGAETAKYKIKSFQSGGGESSYSNVATIEVKYCTGDAQIQMLKTTQEQSVKDQWHNVLFSEPFAVKPIVVASPLTNLGSDPTLIRVRNVTTTGFEFLVKEWDYLDGKHGKDESVSFVAMQPGTYQFGDIKAHAFRSTKVTHNFNTYTYPEAFEEVPVVIGTQVTNSGKATTVIRFNSITETNCSFRIQEEEKNDDEHGNEELNFLALSSGTGTMFGHNIEVGKTGATVNQDWYSIPFSNSLIEPGFFAQVQTINEVDPCAIRYQSLSSSGVQIIVQEGKSKDDEQLHASEEVGWLVIDNINQYVPTAIDENYFNQSITIAPNPVRVGEPVEVLFEESLSGTVEVYNLAGKVMQSRGINNESTLLLDSSLSPGMYFVIIKSSGVTATKKLIVKN